MLWEDAARLLTSKLFDVSFVHEVEEEAENAFQYLTEFCTRRAESIRKQLDGALSCDTAQQDDAKKVDGSMIAVF